MCKDERGNSVISYALILPLFLALLFGSYYVWEIVAIKQSLNRATYLASRTPLIARQYIQFAAPSGLQNQAKNEIYRNLKADGFIPHQFRKHGLDWDRYWRQYLQVDVDTDPARGQHIERVGDNSILFEIRAELEIPWFIRLPLLPARRVTVSARHVGYFWHPDYVLHGTKPSDPEGEGWHVSLFPTPTSKP